jgi:acetyl esterase/lipase
VAATPWLSAAAPAPVEIAYGPDPAQRLDVYPRPDLVAAPTLLFVHGGAWTIGDKRDVNALPGFAERHGCLLASTNHRPGVGAERAAEDVAAAAAWMLSQGVRYGGDTKRLFLMGHSSGGHLAALVGVDPRYLAAHGRAPTDLAGVIGVDGAGYDPAVELAGMALHLRPSEMAMWTTAFGEGAAGLSPIRLVRPDGRYPPFLLLYTDHPGGRKYSQELAAELAAAGDRVAVVEAPGKSHQQINTDLGLPGDAAGERVARFVATGAP